jgi:phosphatidate phosphatase APP1
VSHEVKVMVDWERILAGAAGNVEIHFDRLKERLGGILGGNDPIMIVPYHGYGSQDALRLRGRVLEDEGVREATDNDSLWDNLLNMYRRLESDEIPFAKVRIHFQEQEIDVVADDEGYFTGQFSPSSPLNVRELWHQVELELLEPLREGHPPVRATGQVLVPPASAQFGVVSDIDDTVVRSHATDLLRMARLVFLGNAHTRLPFPGVATFYQALQGGQSGSAQNPLYYLSSSPWNLYDLLLEFFRLHEVPMGPLFLRDWGVSAAELLPTRHSDHKLGVLRNILEFYPRTPFILIGDSGQEDPEIYAQIVDEYPERILAVYIRNVTGEARSAQIAKLAEEISHTQASLILAPDTLAMAEHAAAQGWIQDDTVALVARGVEHDLEAPTEAEALLEEVV